MIANCPCPPEEICFNPTEVFGLVVGLILIGMFIGLIVAWFDRGMVNGRMIDALLTILLFAGLFVIALLGMAFVLLYYALLAVIAVLFIPVALIVVLADAIFTR